MSRCLLCLESIQDVSKCLQMGSTQWKELGITEMIEKHLWSIETITSKSNLCSICWEDLYEFHKFYTRISDAHNLTKLPLTTDDEKEKNLDDILKNLIEPEIVTDPYTDTSFIIKRETEVFAVGHSDQDSDLKFDSLEEDDSDENFIVDSSDHNDDNTCMDSDDSKDLKCKRRSVTKARSTTPEFSEKNFVETDNKNHQKLNNLQKKNSEDFDEFLNNHFKIACDKCHQTFERFRFLCLHYKREHKEQGFARCCETKFYSRNLLVDHINYHLNPEFFKCSVCAKAFEKRSSLHGHMKFHKEKTFCCDICNMKFVMEKMLRKHKLTHVPKSEKKFRCNECGKFYVNEVILKQHYRAVHLNVYARVCEICGQSLPGPHLFKLHMEKHNGASSSITFKCDDCGLILGSQKTLNFHRKIKHPRDVEQKEYNCPICQKMSKNVWAHKRHIREAHEMEAKYECTMCEKKFKRSRYLESHMATHTGIPLYNCPWCSKEFNSSSNMTKHRRNAHPIEWEEEKRKQYSGNLPPNFKRSIDNNKEHKKATTKMRRLKIKQ